MIADRITAYLAEHREQMLTRLSSLCEIASVEAESEEGAPFGREVARALSRAASMFCEEGFVTEWGSDRSYFLAFFGEGDREIGIFTHADVVPGGEGWQRTAPFTPCLSDGALVARGAEDNKGGILAALYLLMAVRDLSLPCPSRLVVFVGGNEETGMRDIEAFCREHTPPAVSFVPDNAPPFSLGEKGMLRAFLVSPPVFSDVLDFRGGEACNVVLARATVTLRYGEALLASLRELVSGQEALSLQACPQEGKILLTAVGRAAHASRPEGSRNAAAMAAELLSRAALPAEERRVLRTAARYLSDPFGNTLGIGGEDAPFGRRTAVTGIVRLSEGRLFLSEDIRFGASVSARALSAELEREAAREDFSLMTESVSDGFDLGDSDPLAERLLSSYRRLTGETEAVPYRSGGGTYARHLPRAYSVGLSVPSVGPSCSELAALGYGGAHEKDECLPIDSYLASLRILTEFVLLAAEGDINE